MSDTYTAAQVVAYGQPLAIATLPKPVPNASEVLVHLLVRPINPVDLFSVAGYYSGFRPASFPAVPGLEGMGVVEAVGPQVTLVKPGQRVVPLEMQGSFQEYIIVSQETLVVLPDVITNEAAAQFVVNPFTVYGLFEQSGVKEGGVLLITAAGSGVGRMIIHVGKLKGIKVIGLVRRAAQVEELLKEGAAHVFVTEGNADLNNEITKASGGDGVDAILDSVVGELGGKISATLKPGKPVIVYGNMDGMTSSLSAVDLISKGIRLEGFNLDRLLEIQNHEQKKHMIDTVLGWMRSGAFATHIGEKFELKDINKALEASKKPGKEGKVLLYTKL